MTKFDRDYERAKQAIKDDYFERGRPLTAPRKTHNYYEGVHTFKLGPEAFEVRWVGGGWRGWYWCQIGLTNWTGPFTSSRLAFQNAKQRGPTAVDTTALSR